jgi:hypothetical protein
MTVCGARQSLPFGGPTHVSAAERCVGWQGGRGFSWIGSGGVHHMQSPLRSAILLDQSRRGLLPVDHSWSVVVTLGARAAGFFFTLLLEAQPHEGFQKMVAGHVQRHP